MRAALDAHGSAWMEYLSLFPQPFDSLLVVRDWQGRFHVGIPGNSKLDRLPSEKKPGLRVAIEALKQAAFPLAYEPDFFFYADELFDAQAMWHGANGVEWDELLPLKVLWIERQGKEKIWTQIPPNSNAVHPLRLVFFGIKGGVGRSSALLATAYHLLSKGKKVLVLDADFESPGVSSTLLNEALRPDYGLVDWFALDALDPNLACDLLSSRRLCERSGLEQGFGAGEVWVAPSYGCKSQDYVGKLGRLYQDVGDQGYVERFRRLLVSLEDELSPDVVLIDSRAGVDDTAALTLTQLDAHGLLFATHGRSTWSGYGHLFSHWQNYARLLPGGEDFRSKLHVVSALSPVDTSYDKAFLDASYGLFQSHLYEELESNQLEGDGFNYGAEDPDAPHYPRRVRWDEMLRHFDPIQNPAQLDAAVFDKVFGELVKLVDQLQETGEA